MSRRAFALGALLLSVAAALAPLSLLAESISSTAPHAQRTIRGTIVDDKGKPVAGAEVYYSLWRPLSESRRNATPGERAAANFDPATAEPDVVGPRLADDRGNFKLTVPQPDVPADEAFWSVIWVYSNGHRLQFKSLEKGKLDSDPEPLRIVLRPPGDVRFKVIDEADKPVVGAVVTVTDINESLEGGGSVHNTDTPAPPKILRAARLTATTDREGFAAIPAVGWFEAELFDVVHPAFGRRTFHEGSEFIRTYREPPMQPANEPPPPPKATGNETKTLKLMPSGRVRGRLMADKAKVGNGAKLYVLTETPDAFGCGGHRAAQRSFAEVTTDAEGRFETSPLAPGDISFEVPSLERPKSGKPAFLLESENWEKLAPGQTREVRLRLKSTVHIHGKVHERGTDKPPDVRLIASFEYRRPRGILSNSELFSLDKAGNFELDELPGGTTIGMAFMEDLWAAPCISEWKGTIPDGVAEFTIPTFEIAETTGRVVDDKGAPLDDVEIECRWRYVGQLPEGIEPQGKRDRSSHDGGTFKFWADPASEFTLKLSGENLETREIPWAKFATVAGGKLPDIVLRRTPPLQPRTVAGRVVDRQGRPVAEAIVFWTPDRLETDNERDDAAAVAAGAGKPIEVTTSGDGRFRLEKIPPEKLPLFVAKPGFRFCGQVIDETTTQVTIELARTNEPPRRMLKTLPPPISHSERLSLSRAILTPYIKRLLGREEDKGNFPPKLVEILPALDPAQTRELLGEGLMKNATDEGALRRGLRASRWETLAPFGADASGFLGPQGPAAGWLRLYENRAATAELKFEYLQRALEAARRVDDSAARLELFGRIAERLVEVGRNDQGTKLFREGQILAAALGKTGEAERADFATRLVRIDSAAAIKLLDGMRDDHRDLSLQILAQILARKDPPQAENILHRLRKELDFTPNACIPAICYRMATVDLKRARRTADEITDPFYKAQAYALMAQALWKSQPAAANSLLRAAFTARASRNEGSAEGLNAGLTGLFGGNPEKSRTEAQYHPDGKRIVSFVTENRDPVAMSAAPLPIVERLDPQLVDELFWQVVAMRRPVSRPILNYGAMEVHAADTADLSLAAILARYDRDVAQTITRKVWKRTLSECRVWELPYVVASDPELTNEAIEAARGVAFGPYVCQTADILRVEDERFWDKIQDAGVPSDILSEDALNQMDYTTPCRRPIPKPAD